MTAAQAPDIEADALERAWTVFGVQHLAKFSGQSREWMDETLGAVIRTTIAAVLAAGFVRPEEVAEAQAKAWDEGYDTGRDDECFDQRGLSTDSDAHEYPHDNPYRAAALRPVDAPEGGA